MAAEQGGLRAAVAEHYNNLPEHGLQARRDSPLVHLRSFNNWIKSVTIGEALLELRRTNPGRRIEVLDLCCGKGGDLQKWKVGRVDKVVFVDLAQTSVAQASERYEDLRRNFHGKLPDAEFHDADCAETRLVDIYDKRDQMFDLVSCQFSFHYSFETMERARTMLRNACEKLKPGGIFIGTIPDSFELLKRLKHADGLQFGNDIHSVTFDSKTARPLFGDRYHFYLQDHVDCPEFLVYFPLLEEMVKEFGMERMYRETFEEYYERKIDVRMHRELAEKLGVLESYPADNLSGSVANGDYEDAQAEIDELVAHGDVRRPVVGCMSKSEWDVCSLYCVFALRKTIPKPPEKPRESQAQSLPDTRETTSKRRRPNPED